MDDKDLVGKGGAIGAHHGGPGRSDSAHGKADSLSLDVDDGAAGGSTHPVRHGSLPGPLAGSVHGRLPIAPHGAGKNPNAEPAEKYFGGGRVKRGGRGR